MLPRLCLGERLVLKVHLCDQKQNSWVLYMWAPLGGGSKEGKKTRTSQRPLRLWGAALSTALSTSLVNTASYLSCVGFNFPLISSAKHLCFLSVFFLYLQKSKGTFFFKSKTHVETRENWQNEQAAVCVSAGSLLILPGPGQNLWDPLKPTKGCKHLSHVTYMWLPIPISTMIKIIKRKQVLKNKDLESWPQSQAKGQILVHHLLPGAVFFFLNFAMCNG